MKKTKELYEKLYREGLEKFRKNQLNDAIENWEEAAKVMKNNAQIYSVLGNTYKLLDDFSESNRNLKKAVELEPDNSKFLINYGYALYQKERYKEALTIFQKALKIEPDNAEVLNDIGVCYFYLKYIDEAVDFFSQAAEVDKEYLDPYINLINCYIEIEKLTKAEEIILLKEDQLSSHPAFLEAKEYLKFIKKHPEKEKKHFIEIDYSENKYRIEPLEFFSDYSGEHIPKQIELSIVIPIKNEEDNIPILYRKLTDVLKNLKQKYEIIFIDDGSVDNSLRILKKIVYNDPAVRVIEFRKNYGQTAAMSAGFKYSHGSVVITMDGDLQNDPEDIPLLLKKMSEGYDLVSGWRKDRQDKQLTRVIPSKLANGLINKLIEGTNIQLHDYGCTLKAYKRGIIKNIHLYGEMHRFIPAFAAWLGVKVAEIPVKHHPRKFGTAKYNLSRVPRVIFDLIAVRFFTDYITRPIQFFGKIAKKLFTYGNLLLVFLTILKLIYPQFILSYDSFFISFGIISLTSLQIIVMGILGEIMMRIYYESQDKDYYIVERVIQRD